jgi:hypothetical protein
MTTFDGFDCLTIPPNAVSAWDSSVTRAVDRTESPSGNVVTTTRPDLGRDTRSLTWNCATRAELTALRAVLDARYGQLLPIWVPTYQRDLTVVSCDFTSTWTVDLGAASAGLMSLINTREPWRFWTAIVPGSATRFYCRRTIATTTLGTAFTMTQPESVADVNGPWLSFNTSANGSIFSRLMLMRLASDGYQVTILGAVATVTADFVQITGA